jgi:hypothetical protein
MQLNSMMNLDSEMQVWTAGVISVLPQEMLIDAKGVVDYGISPVQIKSICKFSLYPPLSTLIIVSILDNL